MESINYNFKKFDKINVRLETRITITKTNSIGFPTQFSIDNGIKKFKYAVLFYDKSSKAIAIQFTNNESETNKFTLIQYEKYGASVIARSFFKVNNIDTEKYHGRYKWKIVEIDNIGSVYVIELNNKNLENKQ